MLEHCYCLVQVCGKFSVCHFIAPFVHCITYLFIYLIQIFLYLYIIIQIFLYLSSVYFNFLQIFLYLFYSIENVHFFGIVCGYCFGCRSRVLCVPLWLCFCPCGLVCLVGRVLSVWRRFLAIAGRFQRVPGVWRRFRYRPPGAMGLFLYVW